MGYVVREGTTQPMTFSVTLNGQAYDLSTVAFILVIADRDGNAQVYTKGDPGWENRFVVHPNGVVGDLVFYPLATTFRFRAQPYTAFLWIKEGTQQFSVPKDASGNDTNWEITVLDAYGVVPE